MQQVNKLKKPSENYLLNIILIVILKLKMHKLFIYLLKELIKFLLMYLKEILMICLDKKVSHKFKKDQNQKEEIIDHL